MQFIKLKSSIINKTSLFPIKTIIKNIKKQKTSITNNEPLIKKIYFYKANAYSLDKKKSQNRQITKKHVYYTLYYAINKIIYIF